MHRRLGPGVALLIVALLCSLLVSAPLASSTPRVASPTPRIAAVGDIACKNPPGSNRSVCQYDDVAASIASRDYDRFLPLGDIQYEYGEYRNFVENYDVYFGRLLDITSPTTGNHEYGTPGARGYFRYFGDRAPGPYYSYELGSWHVVALDSTICSAGGVDCRPGSAQYEWLEADLAAHPAECTLAYWHHPRFSSGPHGDYAPVAPLWEALDAADADLLLAGHDHLYERFAPQSSAGGATTDGLRQITAGTGGYTLYGAERVAPNSELIIDDALGVLVLSLGVDSYDWSFVGVDGSELDSGRAECR